MISHLLPLAVVGIMEGATHQAGADSFLAGDLTGGLLDRPASDVFPQAAGASAAMTKDRIRFGEDLAATQTMEATLEQDQGQGTIPDPTILLALGGGGVNDHCRLCLLYTSDAADDLH